MMVKVYLNLLRDKINSKLVGVSRKTLAASAIVAGTLAAILHMFIKIAAAENGGSYWAAAWDVLSTIGVVVMIAWAVYWLTVGRLTK